MHMPLRVPWHFPLLGPLLLPEPVRGSRGSVTGSRRLTRPLGPGRGKRGGAAAAAFRSLGWDSLSPLHLISFANVCATPLCPVPQRGNGTPQGVCAGRDGEGMWLLAKQTPRQGQEKKEAKKKKKKESGHLWVEGYYRLTLVYLCFSATTAPSLFFWLLACFRFLT